MELFIIQIWKAPFTNKASNSANANGNEGIKPLFGINILADNGFEKKNNYSLCYENYYHVVYLSNT